MLDMQKTIKLTEGDIREMVLESVRKILNESYGINDDMEIAASALATYIRKNILKSPIEYDSKRQMNYHLLSYEHEFEGKKFSWMIIGYIYPDSDNLEDNVDIQFSEGAATSDGVCIFFGRIRFSMTEKGWFNYGEVADSVYHEMLHLLKAKKMGKESVNQEFNGITGTQYNTTTGLAKDIAVICYMSREDEQDAYINGLYGKLKEEFLEHHNLNVGNIFYDSELCKKIGEVKTALDNLSRTPLETVNEYLKPYNTGNSSLTYKKLMNLGKNTLTRLNQKTSRMLKHYHQFLYNKGLHASPPKNILDF